MLASRFPFGIYYWKRKQETQVVAVSTCDAIQLDSAAGNGETRKLEGKVPCA